MYKTTVHFEIFDRDNYPETITKEKEILFDRVPNIGEYIYLDRAYKVIFITTKIKGSNNGKNKIIINVTNVF